MPIQLSNEEPFKLIQAHVSRQFSDPTPIELLPLRAIDVEKNHPESLSTIITHYLDSPNPVLLLLADAGMGKTVYLQTLIKHLLTEWNEDQAIPIYLNLAALKTSFAQLLQAFFLTCGFQMNEITMLKAQRRFIIFADAYDTSLSFIPLCQGANDELLTWPIEKWIITSRTPYFFHQPQYQDLFTYYQGAERQSVAPKVIQLSPLSSEIINQVIHTKLDSSCQDYVFNDEGLLALSSNPLMLTLLLKYLPEMRNKLKPAAYQQLFFAWIGHQVHRLKAHGVIDTNQEETLKQQAVWYIVAMARRLHELREVDICLYSESSFESDVIEAIRAGWQRFLQTSDRFTTLARACCPMQSSSPAQVGLFHPKLIKEISQLIVELPKEQVELPLFLNGYEGSEELADDLNTELRINDTEHLATFISGLHSGHYGEAEFFRIIYATRYQDGLQIAAANAITLLNQAGVPFSELDLSYIKINNANLSHGIFYRTNFERAKLSNINFKNAILREANMDLTELENLDFGTPPTLDSNNTMIFSIKFHPIDSNLVFFAGNDHFIYMYNIAIEKQIHVMNGHKDMVIALAFNRNDILASAGLDRIICIWDVNTGQLSKSLNVDVVSSSISLNADGNILALNEKGKISIWNIDTATEIKSFEGYLACINKNRNLLAFASDKSIEIWNLNNYESTYSISLTENSAKIKFINFNSKEDILQLIFVLENGSIYLWDLNINTKLIYQHASISCVCFSPDGNYIAWGDHDSVVYIWNIQENKIKEKFIYHRAPILALDFNSTSEKLCSGDVGGKVFIGNNLVDKKTTDKSLDKNTAMANALDISLNWNLIAVGYESGKIFLWKLDKSLLIREWNIHEPVRVIKFALKKELLALGAGEKFPVQSNLKEKYNDLLSLWDVNSDRCVKSFDVKSLKSYTAFVSVDFNTDESLLISGEWHGRIIFWDIKRGKHIRLIKTECRLMQQIKFAPEYVVMRNNKITCAYFTKNSLICWDIHKFREIEASYINYIDIDPSSKKIATACQSKYSGNTLYETRLFDVETKECIWLLSGYENNIVIFFNSENFLILAGEQYLRLLNVRTKQQLLIIEHFDSILRLRITELAHIVIADFRGTLTCWRISNSGNQHFSKQLQWVNMPNFDCKLMKIEKSKGQEFSINELEFFLSKGALASSLVYTDIPEELYQEILKVGFQYIKKAIKVNNLSEAILHCENLISFENLISNEDKIVLLENLAECYYIQYKLTNEKNFFEKSIQLFNQENQINTSLIFKIKAANFFYREGLFQRAIDILSISINKINYDDLIYYYHIHKPIIFEELAEEINFQSYIGINIIILAYKLLILSYKEYSKEDKAKNELKLFEEIVFKIENPLGFAMLGCLYKKDLNNSKKAKKYFEKFSLLQKKFSIDREVNRLNHHFLIDKKIKKYKSAKEFCDEIICLTPSDATAYARRGYIRRKLNQIEEAVCDFKKALEIDHEQMYSYYQLARCQEKFPKNNFGYISDEYYKKAATLYQKYINEQKQNLHSENYYRIGKIYELGRGVKIDIEKSMEFYKLSEEINDNEYYSQKAKHRFFNLANCNKIIIDEVNNYPSKKSLNPNM